MASILSAETIPAMYREAAEKFGDLPAFATRDKARVYHQVNFRDLYTSGVHLATGLIDLGVKSGENVAILSDNRYEWILADYGVQLSGAADVPRGTDVTDADIQYILSHSDVKVVFVEHKTMLEKLKKNQRKIKNIKKIIMMDPSAEIPRGVIRMQDLMEKGRLLREKGDRKVEKIIEKKLPDEIFTLIYTSGTTGVPKSVALTHGNMISQTRNVPVEIDPSDRVLSILPVWHVFERMFEMFTISNGVCTYYTTIRNIREDLKIVKPTIMASSPRLWEVVYQGIVKNVESAPLFARRLFRIAYFCASVYKSALRFLTMNELDTTGRILPISLAMGAYQSVLAVLFFLPHTILDFIVLRKIRAATGGKLRGSVSGGGALPRHIDLFFNNIGLPVLEGYGLTETSPVLAVRTFERLVIGTVGPVWPGTEIRIVDVVSGDVLYPPESGRGKKGEIQIRGPQVMKGYYKNKAATDAVMQDGWFRTGDLGMITFNNCLKIVGRSKETIVLLGGENVEPVPIESKLLESPLIEQCMVVGQDRKYLTALIVPALAPFKSYGDTLEELAGKDEVYRAIRDEIKRLISHETGFKGFERVVDCRLLSKAFEVGDEMNNVFKLKRDVVTEKYKKTIDTMYG